MDTGVQKLVEPQLACSHSCMSLQATPALSLHSAWQHLLIKAACSLTLIQSISSQFTGNAVLLMQLYIDSASCTEVAPHKPGSLP